MASIFSKIAAGEIPSYRVASDDRYYAFLDINPVAPGHVLVIPRKEVSYIFDLDNEDYIGLQMMAKRVAKAMKAVMPCERIGVAVIGLEVPHTHIHLIPITNEGDMNFANKLSLDPKEMEEIAARISAEYDRQNA